MTKEVFKGIPGFEFYQISNFGRVKSLKFGKERILKPVIDSKGYNKVNLCKSGVRYAETIAVLVLTTFISNRPPKYDSSHLDGNCLNNKLSNLKWETRKQNLHRRVEHGTLNSGIKHGRSKLKNKDVFRIRQLLKENVVQRIIANKFNVHESIISDIKYNKLWAHI